MARNACERMVGLVAGIALLACTSCGTILYPERHGNRQGRLDPAVLLLDGAVLLLFIVPGLVAYAIDFYTGAIYVPESNGRVTRIELGPDGLDPARIEAVIRAHSGADFRIDDERLQRFRVVGAANAERALEELARDAFASGPRFASAPAT